MAASLVEFKKAVESLEKALTEEKNDLTRDASVFDHLCHFCKYHSRKYLDIRPSWNQLIPSSLSCTK